jgi:O-glycosyl hydrolase
MIRYTYSGMIFGTALVLFTVFYSYPADIITIDRKTTFQAIWGFGGAANHPVQDLKTKFNADAQKALLDKLFRTDSNNVGLSIVRPEINGFKAGEKDPNGAEQFTCQPSDGVWDCCRRLCDHQFRGQVSYDDY